MLTLPALQRRARSTRARSGSDFSGSASVDLERGAGPATQSVDGTLHFPRAVGVGGALRPAPRWTVALDLTWDDWTEAILDIAAHRPREPVRLAAAATARARATRCR